jgi:hypothetical protein
MPFKYFVIFFLLLFLKFQSSLQAQNAKINNDTTVVDSSKLHSPKVATIMSACLPGLGQVYNKKYWKVPLIYAGFGTIGYFAITNGDKYKKFETAYIYRIDNDSTTNDNVFIGYSTEDIKIRKDYYRRNRDLSYIIGVIWYILNIFDASVDAHLFYFNVNDDLSLNFKPATIPLYYKNNNYTVPGMKLSFNIGKFNSDKYIKPKTN